MRNLFFLMVIFSSIILMINLDPAFSAEHQSPMEKQMGKPQLFEQENMAGMRHIPYQGMCAPGFASLGEICVLDDRCGKGIYPGKVCIMDGVMKEYLRPLKQKHAGIDVDNIICAEGKQVLYKSTNAKPACVNETSVEKIIQRGWQTQIPPIACTADWNPVCGVDGITYGNSCMLNAAEIGLDYAGECTE